MQLNREKLADVLGVSLRTVDEYCRQGMPGDAPKRKGDQWRFESAACVGWLRERERSSALGEVAQIDEGEAKRRKLAAEAALAELELAKAEGAVAAIADFGKAGAEMITAARAKLTGIGSAIGPDLALATDPVECRSIVDAAIHEALSELSEFESGLQVETEGDTGAEAGDSPDIEVVGTTAETDGKRMGGRREAVEPRVKRKAR